MTPQVNLDGRERVAEPVTPPAAYDPAISQARPLSDADRQGLAMAWAGLALGMFLLLGGLALWAAVALNAGFVGWIVGIAVMGLVVVGALVAVSYAVIRPRR